MNSNISNGFYIWGQFDIASTELISFLQREVNNDLQGPEFEAHLTLTGPVNYELDICKNLLEELCKRFSEFSVSLNGIDFKDKFFQAFFLRVLFSKELEALKLATDQSFGLSPKEYFPHISLYYGSALQSQKEECSKSLLPPTSVLLNKISLVKIHEDIDEWEIVQTFSL